ncbi:hypothetical protein BGZ96_007249 [Linnemannia gamsii]|uniref:ResB-like domain-containing protein n=1 Tax=Linnemannia gamsii TaxID=64522 RepID=A0ABQ7K0U0_9FUNG|nr:hypothetical protein BGZ96_007249 [Linnemannia gamsii]
MPKRFASDIVVLDKTSQQPIAARIEVNKPFIYRGIAIYQSSFEDGGSSVQFTAYPMAGSKVRPFELKGQINSSLPLTDDGTTLELTDFRAINVENIADADGKADALLRYGAYGEDLDAIACSVANPALARNCRQAFCGAFSSAGDAIAMAA